MNFNLFLAAVAVITYFPGKGNVLQIDLRILFIKVLDPNSLPIKISAYMKIVKL